MVFQWWGRVFGLENLNIQVPLDFANPHYRLIFNCLNSQTQFLYHSIDFQWLCICSTVITFKALLLSELTVNFIYKASK